MGVQLGGYQALLVAGLRAEDPMDRRQALRRWLIFVVAWQVLVVVGCFVYAFLMTGPRRTTLAWVAPPLGALVGTAVPYQLVAMRLARASRQ